MTPETDLLPREQLPLARRILHRAEVVILGSWHRAYARGWDEAVSLAADYAEDLIDDATGPYVAKSDLRALAMRIRREADR